VRSGVRELRRQAARKGAGKVIHHLRLRSDSSGVIPAEMETPVFRSVGDIGRYNLVMHRFYIPALDRSVNRDAVIDLPPEAARQCSRVLKLQPGEKIALFDGSGIEVTVALEHLSGSSVRGRMIASDYPEREARRPLELVMALSRQERWEWALQKATELGVSAFQPIETARCVARITYADWPRKAERWGKIIIEAAEQSGRTRLPTLAGPMSLSTLVKKGNPGIALDTAAGLPSLTALLELQAGAWQERILVGPEGGLEEGEIESLLENGWRSATLGPRTLRCETAALCACALALNDCGSLG